MRIARKFNYCCAYCGTKPERLDPDHVTALSRRGPNVLGNLLPACNQCNGDKRDLTLTEWAADRTRRGLSPRTTSWGDEDSRYWHLTATGCLTDVA
jgi:5-methylcytosine-specific restriction endonuclease McrA